MWLLRVAFNLHHISKHGFSNMEFSSCECQSSEIAVYCDSDRHVHSPDPPRSMARHVHPPLAWTLPDPWHGMCTLPWHGPSPIHAMACAPSPGMDPPRSVKFTARIHNIRSPESLPPGSFHLANSSPKNIRSKLCSFRTWRGTWGCSVG